MLIRCKICQREFSPEPRKKLHGNHEQGLCTECLFLCRQQNQPKGPEKMILLILHEYLVRHDVAGEKIFVRWRDMPILSNRPLQNFWTEAAFGFFLQRRYVVTYVAGGTLEHIATFDKKLYAAFDLCSQDRGRSGGKPIDLKSVDDI